MECYTHNESEIKKFMEGVKEFWLDNLHCPEEHGCFCNKCRTGGGTLYLAFEDTELKDHHEFYPDDLIEWDEEDGGGYWVSTPPPFDEYFKDKKLRLVKYVTGSGNGMYVLDFSKEKPILYFKGRRNSFKGGCEIFRASIKGEWKLLVSTTPERGVWG